MTQLRALQLTSQGWTAEILQIRLGDLLSELFLAGQSNWTGFSCGDGKKLLGMLQLISLIYISVIHIFLRYSVIGNRLMVDTKLGFYLALCQVFFFHFKRHKFCYIFHLWHFRAPQSEALNMQFLDRLHPPQIQHCEESWQGCTAVMHSISHNQQK